MLDSDKDSINKLEFGTSLDPLTVNRSVINSRGQGLPL